MRKKSLLLSLVVSLASLSQAVQADAQVRTLPLDSCRAMAMANNKQMKIRQEQVKGAGYLRKEAFAAYLPGIDFAGGYMYNQKELSIFDSDQLLPTKTFDPKTGSYEFNLVTNPATGMPIKGPDGQYVPQTVALIPKEAMTYDIHNVFFGAVTLTQPIYMGGKILALNKIAKLNERLQRDLYDNEANDVIYAVDAAYWQVVSLEAKRELAVSYVALLDSLDRNVAAMVDAGVATRSDKLSVDVKLNQANIDLVKVDNGLALSKMLLCQLIGIPVDTPVSPADSCPATVGSADAGEGIDMPAASTYDMADVFSRRNDLRALETGVEIAEQNRRLALSSMLPNIALTGMYSFSNPNMFDGFKKRFDGAFSVGVMVQIPIWHWGGNYNKYRAAGSAATVMKLQVEDAKEMIRLQVSQASYKSQEAFKTYRMTLDNMAKADENLRDATLAFREGVATTDIVMAAQTAWLKANSERIDALIDVRLCDVYLDKVLGVNL